MNAKQTNKGFTIIEVVLVLAIAGLIFLMVFIALPALQRNQRDTARKNDVSAVASAVSTYIANNKGSSTLDTTSIQSYVTDKSDNTIKVVINGTAGPQTINAATGTAAAGATAANVQDGLVVVTMASVCGASSANQVLTRGTARQFTVTTKLESANGVAFCQGS